MKKLLLSVIVLLTPLMHGKNESIRMEDIPYLKPFLKDTPFMHLTDDVEIAAFIRICEKNDALVLGKDTGCLAIRVILTNAHHGLAKNKETPKKTLSRIIETAVLIEQRNILDTLNRKIAQNSKQ